MPSVGHPSCLSDGDPQVESGVSGAGGSVCLPDPGRGGCHSTTVGTLGSSRTRFGESTGQSSGGRDRVRARQRSGLPCWDKRPRRRTSSSEPSRTRRSIFAELRRQAAKADLLEGQGTDDRHTLGDQLVEASGVGRVDQDEHDLAAPEVDEDDPLLLSAAEADLVVAVARAGKR